MCKFAYTITLLASVYSLLIMNMPTQKPFLIMTTNNPPKKRADIPCVSTPVKVAVLIDGGFFIKRYNALYNKSGQKSPQTVADDIYRLAHSHVGNENYLYRIFYYDCIPLDKRVHNPISHKCINFGGSPQAKFKRELIEALKKKRKVALRLGTLKTNSWQFRPRIVDDIIAGTKNATNFVEDDICFEIRQKGIDMKIGVDIASIALKKFVDKIVLISGDSDFVPAAKLARREGIDFVLDAMYAQHIDNGLYEHIDGLKSMPLYGNTKRNAKSASAKTASSAPKKKDTSVAIGKIVVPRKQ